MELNEYHKSHIRKVEVSVILSGENINPTEITNILNITPDEYGYKGDKVDYIKGIKHTVKETFWCISSENKVDSKDINDHIKYLLDKLLPYKIIILDLVTNGEVFFNVLWSSTYLYAGTGPIIEKECINGISQLNATIGFDIYQIDEIEEDS